MSWFGFAIVMFILAYFSTHWRTAGKRVDEENKRIARELASLDYWEEEGKRRAEYLRTHSNIPAWWWKD